MAVRPLPTTSSRVPLHPRVSRGPSWHSRPVPFQACRSALVPRRRGVAVPRGARPGAPHRLTREEVIVAVEGRARATVGGVDYESRLAGRWSFRRERSSPWPTRTPNRSERSPCSLWEERRWWTAKRSFHRGRS